MPRKSGEYSACVLFVEQRNGMSLHHTSQFAIVTLISLLPVCALSAETGHDQAPSAVSAEDLATVGERIRQTGAQMREDMKEARARMEARKAQQEAEHRQEAERARQQAMKEAEEQAAIKELKQRQAKEAAQAQAHREAALKAAQAERERQLALATQGARDEQAAKERAAKALKEARKSSGVKAFADESQKERAARALREARQSAGVKAFAEDGL